MGNPFETPLGKLIQKCGYDTLERLGKDVDEIKLANGKPVKSTKSALPRACSGKVRLKEENKAYVIQKLNCSVEEFEAAQNQSILNRLISKHHKSPKEIKELADLEVKLFEHNVNNLEFKHLLSEDDVGTAKITESKAQQKQTSNPSSLDILDINESSLNQINFTEEQLITQGWEYVVLELRTNAIYNNDDSLYTTKIIKIKSLVNNLNKIDNLTYSKFKSEEKDIDNFEIDCYPKHLVKIKKEYNSETRELNINFFFITPLNKGQEVTLFLHQFFTRIIDKDQTCHCTPILCPTLYTKLTVTPPPYVTKGRGASVSEYKSKNDFNCRSDGYRGEPIEDLTLGESGNYEYEKSNPLVDHFFEIHWGIKQKQVEK